MGIFYRSSPFLVVLVLFAPAFGAFIHPGLLHTQADFNRMQQMVQNNTSPWVDSWRILLGNSYSPTFQPSPKSIATRGSGCNPGDNSYSLMDDIAAAYQLALHWKISGDTGCADAAVRIMNAWSSTLQQISCPNGSGWDFILMAGIQGYQFANVGEIMRSYSGLTAANFTAFQNMMRNVFYPVGKGWLPTTPLNVYSSWDLLGIAMTMAIGVLTDNSTMFNEAITEFYTASGNGGIENMVYFVHDGYLGQTQESGRDQGHNTLSISLLGVIAEQAWNQGVDLYGYSNNRVLAASEYVAKGNLNDTSTGTYYSVPFTVYTVNDWPTYIYDTSFSTSAIGTKRPIWASIYHHYVNRKGMAAPYTGKMMNLVAPDGGGGNYGSNSGGYDQLGFETLTFTRSPIASGIGPNGLTGYFGNANVVLSWWGSAGATSYNVYRSTNSSGTFTKIASVTDPLTYTDSGLSAGTYYYRVTSVLSPWESSPTPVIKVVANPQTLNTYLKLDETSGTSAADSSGNGNNANLVGGASHVAGISGNAVQLDGSSGYVSLPYFVLQNQSDFTIATWLKLNSLSTWMRLFDFGFGTGRYMFFAPQGNNGNATFAITTNQGPGQWNIVTGSPLPVGKWVHVAVTLSATTGTIYINGTSAASNSGIYQKPYQLALGANAFTPQVWIGRSQFSGDPYLNGIVDDFRIYQGALTASQVSALYSSGASG